MSVTASVYEIGGINHNLRIPREPESTVGAFARHGTRAGELAEPFGIAVDDRTGDVYVVDSNNMRVAKYTSTGRFLRAWGWGVADGRTPALQVCTKRCFPGKPGAGAGQFENKAEGVAVDNDPGSPSFEDVYVVDLYNNRVQKFSPSGKFLLMFGGSVNQTAFSRHADDDICPLATGDVCGIGTKGSIGARLEFAVEGSFVAVGARGTVYIGQRNSVKIFTSRGRYSGEVRLVPVPARNGGWEPGGVSALAVDARGDMYAVRNSIVGIGEYSPSGKLLRTLEPGGQPAYPEGPTPALTLDGKGDLFVDVYANYLHRVDEYDPAGKRLASFDVGTKAPPQIADKEDGLPGMAYNPRNRRLYLVNADINLTPLVARVRIVSIPSL